MWDVDYFLESAFEDRVSGSYDEYWGGAFDGDDEFPHQSEMDGEYMNNWSF